MEISCCGRKNTQDILRFENCTHESSWLNIVSILVFELIISHLNWDLMLMLSRDPTHKEAAENLSEDDWKWLQSLPYYIEVPGTISSPSHPHSRIQNTTSSLYTLVWYLASNWKTKTQTT
jgi:hypothetical protein